MGMEVKGVMKRYRIYLSKVFWSCGKRKCYYLLYCLSVCTVRIRDESKWFEVCI